MNHYSPRQRARRRLALLRSLLLWGALFAALHLVDTPTYRLLVAAGVGKETVEGEDWYELLRAAGSLITWLIIGAALVLHDRLTIFAPRDPWRVHRRGVLVIASAAGAGLLAELLKVLIARERPILHEGEHVFRPLFSSLFDASGLGLPSSHTAVAFGGAAMLGMLLPGVGPVALLVALGCGISRILTGAHFVTDVFLGALVSVWLARVLYRRFGPERHPDGSIADVRGRLGWSP